MMSKAKRTSGGNRVRVLLAIALLAALMLPQAFTAPVVRATGGPPDATFTNISNPSQGGYNVWGVAVADFNGDGKQDMAVTAIDDSLTIYSGNGDGTFTLASRIGGIGGWNVVAADFNGDGKPDLAVVDRYGNKVAVLMNTTPVNSFSITFAPVQTFAVGSSPVGLAVGDFNGDGKPDLVVSNSSSSTSVSILRNTTVTGSATAMFAPANQIEVGNPSLFVAVGDFDGDGKADIAVGGQTSTTSGGGGTLRILMNTSAAYGGTSTEIAFGAYVPITNGVTDPLNLVVGDFNGDGSPDLAVTNGTTGAVSVLLNTGASSGGTFTPAFAPAPGSPFALYAFSHVPVGIAAADFNGDGKLDIVATSQGSSISVLLNDGTGHLTLSSAAYSGASENPNLLGVGDFNGDGKPDFVAVQGGSSTVSIFTNTSAAFIMPTHIRATIGDNSQTFIGYGYDLYAEVTDANYNPLVGVGVTFTVNPVNGAGGDFYGASSKDTITQDGSNGTTIGWTEAFPTANNTAGQFTVTATVDGHPSLSTTFTLTNVARSPVPVINALDDYQNGAGLVPSVVLTSQSPSPLIIINGSGFTDQSQVYYNSVANPNTLLTTVFYDEFRMGAFVDPSLLPSAGSTGIYVLNPPSNAGGDGGSSNQSTLSITQSASAPTGSHIVVDGSTTIIAAAGYPDVIPTFHLVDGSGNVIAAGANNVIAAGANNVIAAGSGNVIAAGSGNVIAAGAHNLIATSAGDVIASGAFNFTSGGGSGNMARASAGQQTRAGAATSGGAPGKQATVAPAGAKATVGRNTLSNRPSSGTYVATPDAKGIYYTPALLNNGTPGTYTRTISVPGITQPITFTITNLKPNDGHPTAITGLSPATATAGGAAFTLTVNGTGFVRASVIAFGGIQLVTTFVSATRLTAVVASDLIARAATPGVVVINPDPNGGASVSATFTIVAPPGLPTITSLSPASVAVGAPAYTLTVNGTNFTGGSTVTFNGTTLTTTFVSATQLTAMVPTSAVATAGTAQVAVVTPPPGGGTASAVAYIIGHVNPEPPPRPPVASGGAPNPLPSARATVQPITGPPPAPVPPKR